MLTCSYKGLQEVLFVLLALVYLYQGALDEGILDRVLKNVESLRSVQFDFVDLE